jgi:hypothetical protein
LKWPLVIAWRRICRTWLRTGAVTALTRIDRASEVTESALVGFLSILGFSSLQVERST